MINDRIMAIITQLCNGNKSLFAKKVGVSPSVVGNITGERQGNPSFEVIEKIIYAFECVNPDWLLTGRGEMLLKKSDDGIKVVSGSNNNGINTSIINNSQMRNSHQIKNDKSDTENALKMKIEFLEQILSEKDKMIAEKERYIILLEQQTTKH